MMATIALGFGEADSSFRSPMAVAVVGGLATSTLLGLLVIPVASTYVDDFSRLLGRFRRRADAADNEDMQGAEEGVGSGESV